MIRSEYTVMIIDNNGQEIGIGDVFNGYIKARCYTRDNPLPEGQLYRITRTDYVQDADKDFVEEEVNSEVTVYVGDGFMDMGD